MLRVVFALRHLGRGVTEVPDSTELQTLSVRKCPAASSTTCPHYVDEATGARYVARATPCIKIRRTKRPSLTISK